MNKKYEFTGEEKQFYGRTLKRIKAKKDFENVACGDIGGWIEREENLDQNGTAWIYDNARVFGEARVYDNAKVSGNAEVYDNAKVYGEARVFGDACVYENAKVSGNAEVYDNAYVFDNAWVCGNAKVKKTRDTISFTKVGSRNDTLTAFKTKMGFSIKVGCFLGSLEQFLKKVQESHENNKFAQEYRAIAEVIKIRFEVME